MIRESGSGFPAGALKAPSSGVVEVDGHLEMGDSKQVRLAPGSAAAPGLCNKLGTNHGFDLQGNIGRYYILGAESLLLAASRFRVNPPFALDEQTQAISAAGTTIDSSKSVNQVDFTVTGNLTGAPVIEAGVDVGQVLWIENVGTGSPIIQDVASDADSGVRTIGGADQTLTPGDVVGFTWTGTYWKQLAAVAALT